MTQRHRRLAAALGFVAAAVAAPLAGAQTFANGPYYAAPSWDQTMPASTRFIVLTNMNGEAVLDRETGLVWWRMPTPDLATLFAAQFNCARSTVGGRRGWRLPAASELLSLFDPAATAPPFLPAGHPFLAFPARSLTLWTSTARLGDTLYLQLGYAEVPSGGTLSFF